MMRPTVDRPAAVLVVGLIVVLTAALAPAGLAGRPLPAFSWIAWTLALVCALVVFRAAGLSLRAIAERVAWLLPLVVLLALPVAAFAPPGRRSMLLLALGVRALAALSASAATATLLGAVGLVSAARQLRVPSHVVAILASTLASLESLTRQLRHMLRAREARRPSFGPWPAILTRPEETVRSYGRLAAALLLRSLERAELLEQARRARGGEL